MSLQKCSSCNSSNLIDEEVSHQLICGDCGLVLQSLQITNSIEFLETSSGGKVVSGVEVGYDQTYSTIFNKSNKYISNNSKSSEQIKQIVSNICHSLNLPSYFKDQILNVMKLIRLKSFIRGKNLILTIGGASYFIIRKNNFDLFLLDLSLLLQVNMFKLGQYYLDICQLLFQKPKPIDPSHYIARFANSFGLGQKTLDVIKDALKLAKSLKLDYLEFGKRPAGVSGVCLLLASRMNHFNRSIDDIAKVVKVSPITIKRRLREFAGTGASSLTIGEFRDKICEVDELPEFNLDQRLDKADMGLLSPPDSSRNSCRGANSLPSTPSVESPISESVITPAESCNNDEEELNNDLEDETDQLSDTEIDKELDNYLLNPSETLEKQKLWELENEEFYQAQQIRLKQKALLANSIKSSNPSKRKRDYNYNLQSSEESVNKILKVKQVPKCFEGYASEISIKKLFNK